MTSCIDARNATINKNIEIKHLQGLLMSTTITAGKENNKKENRSTMIRMSPKTHATFCKNMRVPNILAVVFPNAAKNTEPP
jgi:hypothetical protein